jgi:8-oxo-dGTP diphosphatase
MTLRLNFAVATDTVVLSIENRELTVLLVKRGMAPFAGSWALPGGFVLEDESLEASARRELAEETGVTDLYLEQLYTFGDIGRDARGRVVTVAYLALLKSGAQNLRAGTDATDSQWFPLLQLPDLAFDHAGILQLVRARLANKVTYSNIALQLLPDEFTLAELQDVHEILTGRDIDKRNFRKQVAAQGMIAETGSMRKAGAHRPAGLYRASHPGRVVYFD